jgi:hypothetical protein
VLYRQVTELPERLSTDPDLGVIAYEILDNETVYVYIEFSDWSQFVQTGVGPDFYITDPFIPLGGHEGLAFYAGRLVIAEGIEIDLKHEGGYNRRKTSDLNTLRTYGGTLRGTRNALHWDEHDFNARIQKQSAVLGELDSFFEIAGTRNRLVIIPDERVPGQSIYVLLSRWELVDVGAWVPSGEESDDAEQYFELSMSAMDARARHTLA